MAVELLDLLEDNAWTLPTADGTARLRVTELGDGPLVVTLHGGPAAHYRYLVDAVRCCLADARFVLFDQRGSLQSAVPSEAIGRVTIDQLVDDLESLRLALDRDQLVLFGHSWGSLIAQFYYLARPERVAGLIFTGAMWPFSPPASYETELRARQLQLSQRPEVRDAIRRAGLDGDISRLTARQASDRRRITDLAAITLYRIENWRQAQSTYWNRDVAVSIDNSLPAHYDVRPTLSQYPIPVSIIQGDHDYADPSAGQWATLTSDHPAVDVTVIPDAGHSPWVDDPDVFARALATAIARVGVSSG